MPVILTIETTPEAAARLRHAFEHGQLRELAGFAVLDVTADVEAPVEMCEGVCPICHTATVGFPEDRIGSGIMACRKGDPKGVMWPAIPCRGQHILAELRAALGFNFRPNDPPDTFL